jgi:hypothetical protein
LLLLWFAFALFFFSPSVFSCFFCDALFSFLLALLAHLETATMEEGARPSPPVSRKKKFVPPHLDLFVS